jgi:hypothetical protein
MLVFTRAVDPRRMKWVRWWRNVGMEVGLAVVPVSPIVSWTRSPASTPYCRQRAKPPERAFKTSETRTPR